jgi:hypothetical protein
MSEMNREGLMSSRSERYLAKAEKCQQVADAANISGTKRLFGVMASQWRQLAEEADWDRPDRVAGSVGENLPCSHPSADRRG